MPTCPSVAIDGDAIDWNHRFVADRRSLKGQKPRDAAVADFTAF
jgi:hypothetical protein